MKKLFLYLLLGLSGPLFITACQSNEQEESSNTSEFRDMAQGEEFRNDHKSPEALEDNTEAGEMMSFETEDNNIATGYVVKAKKPGKKYLLVFQEWWGLNDHIKKSADLYASLLGNEVTVIAPDLYDGKVAKTPEEAEKLVQNTSDARVKTIIDAVLKYAGSDAEIGTLGWCYGGGWSLRSAIMAGDRAEACVMYYGMPVKEIEQLKRLDAPVLGIFGKKDNHITPEVVKNFEQNMKKAGESLEVHSYDAVHAFANPSNPDYDSAATQEAREITVRFLKNNLLKGQASPQVQ